jgi:hypothetical protein
MCNSYVYEQRPALITDDALPEGEVEDTTCLECVGGINQRLMLQPTSLDSESHARMSVKISEKYQKQGK